MRGPLKVLVEQLLAQDTLPVIILDYVSSFREQLYRARELAREHLMMTQAKMKNDLIRKVSPVVSIHLMKFLYFFPNLVRPYKLNSQAPIK